MKRAISTSIILVLAASPMQDAFAFDFKCQEFRPMLQNKQFERPEPPLCASGDGGFFDEGDFEAYRSKMTAYGIKIRDYSSCLPSEADQAVEEFDATVKQFNLRASQ